MVCAMGGGTGAVAVTSGCRFVSSTTLTSGAITSGTTLTSGATLASAMRTSLASVLVLVAASVLVASTSGAGGSDTFSSRTTWLVGGVATRASSSLGSSSWSSADAAGISSAALAS